MTQIFVLSKLKTLADDEFNVKPNIKFVFHRKHHWKRTKCFQSASSPFPTMFANLSVANFVGYFNL